MYLCFLRELNEIVKFFTYGKYKILKRSYHQDFYLVPISVNYVSYIQLVFRYKKLISFKEMISTLSKITRCNMIIKKRVAIGYFLGIFHNRTLQFPRANKLSVSYAIYKFDYLPIAQSLS